MEQIQRLLDSAAEEGSLNILRLDDVRAWLADYFAMHDEETVRFPEQRQLNHWDLLAADYDTTKDAQFLAAYFADGSVTFLAGRGVIADVRAFGTDDFPENPDEVLNALSAEFSTSDRWTSNLVELTDWVNDLVKIRLAGWRVGLRTVSAIKLIRERTSLGLKDAKTLIEEVMQGESRCIRISGRTSADQFICEAAEMGLIAEIVR